MEARWGLELWDCVDQVLAEVAANNTFLSSTCSKYIRSHNTCHLFSSQTFSLFSAQFSVNFSI